MDSVVQQDLYQNIFIIVFLSYVYCKYVFSTIPIFSIFKFAPKTPEKFLVCENLLGNKSDI